MQKRKKKIKLCAIALLALGTFLMSSCSKKQETTTVDNQYETMTIHRQSVKLEQSYSASLKGVQDVEIRPQVSGTITKICVKEGAIVKKGQPLFIIDQVPYQAALETAEANVRVAEANVATARATSKSKDNLFNKNIISSLDRQTATNTLNGNIAQLALARAELKNARNNLSYTVVKSPVDGKIGMLPYKVGALVSPQIEKALTTVSDNSNIYAYFSMTENEVLSLVKKSGSLDKAVEDMPLVRLALGDGSTYQHQGRIDAVSNIVDNTTGAVSLRATFPNQEHILASGGSASVIFPYEKEDCIVIPQAATYEVQDKVYVYKVINGKAVATMISILSINDGKQYVVNSGLKPGDVIVSVGVANVKDGQVIVPKEIHKANKQTIHHHTTNKQ